MSSGSASTAAFPASESWRALYPFASHEIRIDGLRYHYLDEGHGKPLLLVHGNPTWSFHWRNLVLALRGRYRLIVPDHIGCGLSDKPQFYPYRLAGHITNLRRLIDTLDLRDVTLMAQDWGGAIGLGAAVAEPERFSRFVLFNTGAFHGERIPLRIAACRIPLLGQLAVQGANGFVQAALRMALCNPSWLTPAVRAGYLAPYNSWSNRIATHRFVLDIPMRPAHPSYTTLANIEQRLPDLRPRPVQLIWGMRDWCFTSKFLDRFVEIFPQAEVHRLADAGHWVVEDAAERVVPLVEQFLAER